MNPETTPKTQRSRWSTLLLSVFAAGLLCFITYMIYLDAARNDEIASSSPSVLMKVTGRKKGAGTLKYPDHVYAYYQGKQYDFVCGRRYFNKTLNADRIVAHLDKTSGEAALPGSGRVRHLTFLFVLIIGVALTILFMAVQKFIKTN
ncbi:hypothetical protein [Spirosoma flavus]